jgi:hypothetical protein
MGLRVLWVGVLMEYLNACQDNLSIIVLLIMNIIYNSMLDLCVTLYKRR